MLEMETIRLIPEEVMTISRLVTVQIQLKLVVVMTEWPEVMVKTDFMENPKKTQSEAVMGMK